MKANILLADDDAVYVATMKDYLARAGYSVWTEANFDDTRRALEQRQFDVAILDVRLTRNDDNKDTGGLLLAKACAPNTPKIVVTAYPNWEDTRETMAPAQDHRAAKMLYLAKQEGPQALLDAITVCLNASKEQRAPEHEAFHERLKDEYLQLLKMVRRDVNNLTLARLLLAIGGALLIFAGGIVVIAGFLGAHEAADRSQVVGTVASLSGIITEVLSKLFDKPIKESQARLDRIRKWLEGQVAPTKKDTLAKRRG